MKWIKAKWKSHERKKTPFMSTPAEFKKSKKYVFLSLQGFTLQFAMLVLLLFCINYRNNIGIAYICVLMFVFFLSLFRNHFSLRHLAVIHASAVPHHEQTHGEIVFQFVYRKKMLKYPLFWMEIEGDLLPVELSDEGRAQVVWKYKAIPMGLYHIPSFRIQTLWPHAITKTWCHMKLDATIPIAPAPSNNSAGNTTGHSSLDYSAPMSSSRVGEIEGIRDVLAHEQPAKIAWKHTLKHGKMMTYSWEKPDTQVMVINWPSEDISNEEKIRRVRSQMDHALRQQLPFRVVHPKIVTSYGQGEEFATQVLCSLIASSFDQKDWPQEVK